MCTGAVLSGTQSSYSLYVCTSDRTVHVLEKATGEEQKKIVHTFLTPAIFCCAVSPGRCPPKKWESVRRDGREGGEEMEESR